jgi:hypothetical protein
MPFTGEIDPSEFIANLGDPASRKALRPVNTPRVYDEPDRPADLPESDEPFRGSWQEIDMSTSMGLNAVPKLIWDVNGYYRSFGIGWPFRPSRGDLRLAYHEKRGWESERLTYILKLLLDPETRDEYDSSPLGHLYRDKYILAAEMRKLSKVAAEVSEENGKVVTVEDLVEEHEREFPKLPELPSGKHIYWNWGYYLLKTRKYGPDNLAKWQEYLVKSFAEKEVVAKISIGYIGKTQRRYSIIEHDGRVIFFLNENEEPTEELAETAVSLYTAH